MATLGLLASWAAALLGGWAFVGGLASGPSGHPVRRSAERALIAAALAAAVAATALVMLLLAGDVTISYVARSITTNLPRSYRFAALWNLPAGAVLPTAALVAVCGRWAAHRARSSLGTSVTGAIVMALCAASLAATPFATLPWVPTDGLGLAAVLQHPLSVVGRLGLTLAIGAAAALVALSADSLADSGDVDDARLPGLLLLTAALLAAAMWAGAQGAHATDVDATPAALVAWRGRLIPALVALVLAWTARRSAAAASFATVLGALGLMSAVLLGATPTPASGWASSLFSATSLGAATIGALAAALAAASLRGRIARVVAVLLLSAAAATSLWLTDASAAWLSATTQWLLVAGGIVLAVGGIVVGERAANDSRRSFVWLSVLGGAFGGALGLLLAPVPSPVIGWCALAGASLGVVIERLVTSRRSDRLAGTFAALAVTFGAMGAAGEGAAITSSVPLAGGASVQVTTRFGPAISLAHQGISRFEDDNAHVEAVALEPTRASRTLTLLSADRREFVDSRDELLGPAKLRPATLSMGLESLRVRVEDIAADERVMLRLTVVPFAPAWPVAVACLVIAALISFIPGADRRSGTRSAEPAAA